MKKDKINTTAAILLKEPLNISNVLTAKESFVNSLKKDGIININHKEVETCDVTYLQLLISLKKSTDALNKTLNFSLGHPECLNELIKNAGFSARQWLLSATEIENNRGAKNE